MTHYPLYHARRIGLCVWIYWWSVCIDVWVSVYTVKTCSSVQSGRKELNSLSFNPLLSPFPSYLNTFSTNRTERGEKQEKMEKKRRRKLEERSPDYWSPSCWTVLFGARALDKQFGRVQSAPCIDRVLATTGPLNVTVCLSVCLSVSLASIGGESPFPGHVTSCCCPIGWVA